MTFYKTFSFVILAITLFSCQPSKEGKPNVIVIYTDDQGAIDLNIYGSTDLETPNMDAIAQSGVRFTQFYGAPVCSPSRAGLLTGKTPQRAGVPSNVRTVTTKGLPSEQYTMAEMFKDAGYATAHIGKWQLGYQPGMLPTDQGFDHSFGHYGGCIDNYSHFYFWSGPNKHDLYRNGKEVFHNGEFFPDLMVDEAATFISEGSEDPFFIYFAMNTPHYPYQGSPRWIKYYQDKGVEYPRDLYAAFVSTQDEVIGKLINKLKSMGEYENTIIVLQSDNGHAVEARAHYGGGNSGPYRGAKSCLFEGGFRVPAAISWPNKIPKNEVRGQFSVNADWMPTLAELCDISLNTEMLDGKSLVPVIKDDQAKSRHNEMFCWQYEDQWAVRNGKWKLLGNPVDKTNMAVLEEKDSLFLVDLEKDLGEMNNLAQLYPEVVQKLKKQFKDWQQYNASN